MSKTRVCKECGKELPIENFKINNRHSTNPTPNSKCRKCCYKSNRRLVEKKRREIYSNDLSLKLHRSYKTVYPERVLDISTIEITRIKADEIFVRLIDYKEVWISNYGRIITRRGNKYSVMRKKINKRGEISYNLYENVYNGEKWIYKKKSVEAWRLVTSVFIVNHDIANNTCCWHKKGDKADNYYKNIYPLNEYQYAAVDEYFSATGDDSENAIYEIINSVDYKPEGWKILSMRRSVCGIGYSGCDNAISSEYTRWNNMMNRCYNDKIHKNKPYYESCTVCEEWHNFANFREWYNKNKMGNKKLDLDKDILIQGNTEYSPETCSLVTHFSNTIFENRGIQTSIVPNNGTGKYDAFMSILGSRKEIGSYDTEKEAIKAFADYKREYILTHAKKSKNKVPNKVYDAMMKWEMNITD